MLTKNIVVRTFLVFSIIVFAQLGTIVATDDSNTSANYACVLLCEAKLEVDLSVCYANDIACKTGVNGVWAAATAACLRFAGSKRLDCVMLAGDARSAGLATCASNYRSCLRRADSRYRTCKYLCSFNGGSPA